MDAEQLEALLGKVTASLESKLQPFSSGLEALRADIDKLKAAPASTPAATTAATPAAPTPAPASTPAASPEVNAKLLEQQRAIEEANKAVKALQEANRIAEEKAALAQKQSAIDNGFSALSSAGFSFINDDARNTARQLVESQVKRDEAGNLTAGDNLPVDSFIKDWLTTKHGYFFAAQATGGSGAGVANGIRPGAKVPMMEDIKPGMSAETRQAIYDHLAALRRAQ